MPEGRHARQRRARGLGASDQPRSGTIHRTVTVEHPRGATNVLPLGAGPGDRIGDQSVPDPRIAAPRHDVPKVEDPMVVAPRLEDLRREDLRLEDLRLKDPRVEEPRLGDPRVGEPPLDAVAGEDGAAPTGRASS